MVVRVGVHPQVGYPLSRPVYALVQHAPAGAVAADAVNGAVGGGGILPRALDLGVGGIVAGDQRKDAVDAALVLHHVQVAVHNILPQQRLRGIAVDPLGHVAALPHELPGDVVDLQNTGQVTFSCVSYHGRVLSSSGFAAGRECVRRGR